MGTNDNTHGMSDAVLKIEGEVGSITPMQG